MKPRHKLTPKQVLVAHITKLHPVVAARPGFDRMPIKVLIASHRQTHRDHWSNHTHAPSSLSEPMGWSTGQEVVMNIEPQDVHESDQGVEHPHVRDPENVIHEIMMDAELAERDAIDKIQRDYNTSVRAGHSYRGDGASGCEVLLAGKVRCGAGASQHPTKE